jgi:prophage regulatory protein
MQTAHHRLLRRPEVEHLVGLRRSAIYDAMSRGEFPRPVRIGRRAVAWREADVLRWLDALQLAE